MRPLFYVVSGALIAVLIVLGLLARTDEGRQIIWSLAALSFVGVSMVAYATG